MKKAKLFIPLILTILLFVSCAGDAIPSAGEKPNPALVLQEQKSIIHAAGEIKTEQGTYSGTNSMEAFDYWYEKGYRIFEFDFNFTTDNELACIHHWESDTNKVAISMEEFLNRKNHNLTPMNIDRIAEKLKADPGLFIVTDIKENNVTGIQKIAEKYPELRDQFIIQIYNYREYDAVSEAGYNNVLLTIYAMDTYSDKVDTATIAKFAKDKKLFALTFPYELCELDGYVEGLKESGVPLLVHTVNETEQQKHYFDLGIDGIYADTPPALSAN